MDSVYTISTNHSVFATKVEDHGSQVWYKFMYLWTRSCLQGVHARYDVVRALIGMGYTVEYIPCRPVTIIGRYSRTPCPQTVVLRRFASSDKSR